MAKYCKCGASIHPVRQKYGYKTCVKCSSVERVASAPITNHKTGNTIQIVSQAQSIAIHKASRRKGYGTCLR
jgi:hypothetical protein